LHNEEYIKVEGTRGASGSRYGAACAAVSF
jgi:hypothetical protein